MNRPSSKLTLFNVVTSKGLISKFVFASRTLCIALMLLAVQAQPLSACPTCKGSLHGANAMGYAISIVFMMAMPFAILLFWVVTIMRLRAKMLEPGGSCASENGSSDLR
jgi:hypothetical protein